MWERILQAVFPDQCLGCNVYGSMLCHRCVATCPVYTGDVPDMGGVPCAVQFVYTGVMRRAILVLKYAGRRRMAGALAAHLPAMVAGQRVCYVAIPAAPARVAQRGYDQAVLLANALARQHRGYVSQQLVRVRNTPTQAKLDRHARQRNVQGVFAWHGPAIVDPIVLVDDVCTTGATLQSAIAVLREAGMHQIVVQVVARGVLKE
jgi:ComF family protein